MNYSAEHFHTVGELLETNHLQINAIDTAVGLMMEHADNGEVVYTIGAMLRATLRENAIWLDLMYQSFAGVELEEVEADGTNGCR